LPQFNEAQYGMAQHAKLRLFAAVAANSAAGQVAGIND
jgi:hypothetical protein